MSNARTLASLINGSNIVVPSGYGLDFSANANASGMTSEVLDDYEYGNWDIEFVQSSDFTTRYTATNDGRYLKIGNLVFCTMQVFDNASGSPSFSGDVLIKLPFANSVFSHPFYPTYYVAIGGIDSGHIYSSRRDYLTLTNNRAIPLGNNVSNVTFGTGPRLYGSFIYMV